MSGVDAILAHERVERERWEARANERRGLIAQAEQHAESAEMQLSVPFPDGPRAAALASLAVYYLLRAQT